MTQWYRYDSYLVSSGLDEHGVWWGDPKVQVRVSSYPVTKETRKGVWLNVYGSKKFVLRDARKRWACPTKEEAQESFIRRKQRQIGILSHQLMHAKAAEHLARALSGEPDHVWFEEAATFTPEIRNLLKGPQS